MEPDHSGELSDSADEKSEMSANASSVLADKLDEEDGKRSKENAEISPKKEENAEISPRKEENVASVSVSASCLSSGPSLIQGDITVTKMEESNNSKSSREVDKGRKSSARSKNNSGKRKVKVDWTPELHRKFVQVVEQLGLDKAVPSRILELMGTDCLTRHNVASHLQKYRTHQKHLLAREAEAARWSRKRQSYVSFGGPGKRDLDSRVVQTTGFPSVTPRPHFRPLHVWGHPLVDQSYMYTWPQPPLNWPSAQLPPPHLPADSSFWYYHQQDVAAQGIPCVLPHFPPTGFPTTPPVTGIPPNSTYNVDPRVGALNVSTIQTLAQPPCDFISSEESIDEIIGDVLSKPWMPLPLGLKPPSINGVIVELKRQGKSQIHTTGIMLNKSLEGVK